MVEMTEKLEFPKPLEIMPEEREYIEPRDRLTVIPIIIITIFFISFSLKIIS